MWLGAAVLSQLRLLLGRRRGEPGRELAVRRSLRPWLALEHAALVVVLGSGLILMQAHGWGIGHPRWLAVKLGLVAFLVLPLEAMHAWVCHAWIARGLDETAGPQPTARLRRGIGMDDMVRTLAAVLLGLAVPLMAWLSVRRPF